MDKLYTCVLSLSTGIRGRSAPICATEKDMALRVRRLGPYRVLNAGTAPLLKPLKLLIGGPLRFAAETRISSRCARCR